MTKCLKEKDKHTLTKLEEKSWYINRNYKEYPKGNFRNEK